jgi:hypothetical protein
MNKIRANSAFFFFSLREFIMQQSMFAKGEIIVSNNNRRDSRMLESDYRCWSRETAEAKSKPLQRGRSDSFGWTFC